MVCCDAVHHQRAVLIAKCIVREQLACVCGLPVLFRRFCLALTKARISASVCWSPVRGMEADDSFLEGRALKYNDFMIFHVR